MLNGRMEVKPDPVVSLLLVCKQLNVDIEEEFGKIETIITSAVDNIHSITLQDWSEIRSIRFPPACMVDVLTALFKILGHENLTFDQMTRRTREYREFSEMLITFDPRNISADVKLSVEALFEEKSSSFQDSKVKNMPIGIVKLFSWVQSQMRCAQILTTHVYPMQFELDEKLVQLRSVEEANDDEEEEEV